MEHARKDFHCSLQSRKCERSEPPIITESLTPLRVGFLCDSPLQPLWIRSVLSELVIGGFIEVPLVAIVTPRVQSSDLKVIDSFEKFKNNSSALLYRLYGLIDRVFSPRGPDSARRDRVALINSSEAVVPVPGVFTSNGFRFDQDGIASLISYHLDVLLCVGVLLAEQNDIDVFRQGIWTIETASGKLGSPNPVGFWEVMDNHPVMWFEIKRRDLKTGGTQLLCRSVLPTHLPDDLFSVHGAYNRMFWALSTALKRTLKNLSIRGSATPETLTDTKPREPSMLEVRPVPTNAKMVRIIVKRAVQRVCHVASGLINREQWELGYLFRDSLESSLGFHGVTRMTPPGDRFWADPFPLRFNDTFLIFFEEFTYDARKGHISVIEMDEDGRWKPPVPVLQRDYHLSYPFVFEWEGSYYMIPETGSNKTVELYKSNNFPFQWELDKVLIDGIEAADPTLVEIEGVWWLFAATRPYEVLQDDNFMDLSFFFAKSPRGPWVAHRENPVKSDVRNSRPAGRLFWREGNLYRPAQDCSRKYGFAVSINRIHRVSPDEFDEVEVSKIYPEWFAGASRIHTVNVTESLTVVDLLHSTNMLQ